MGSPPPANDPTLGAGERPLLALDALPGVRRGRLVRHLDPRGSFRELWRASWFVGAPGPSVERGTGVGPGSWSEGGEGWAGPSAEARSSTGGGSVRQANLSTSATGVLRGLHVHRRQDDYWVVLEGRSFVALVDLRPAIAAERPGTGEGGGPRQIRPVVAVGELAADEWLAIPAGVAHGFLALAPLSLLYLVSAEYDGTDELGFAWDDPLVAVPWPPAPGTPDGRPILSTRDGSAPSLTELLRRLRRA
jgi:dTDP-4-dehydrorhamnose 3,5-epimerase